MNERAEVECCASDVPSFDRNERRTRWVVALTLITMVVEIGVGRWSGSMALTADGWHMGSHAGALGLTLVGYWYARRAAASGQLTFGVGKVLALAGYTSAILLGLGALWMIVESGYRLISPTEIHFQEAIGVAVVGLLVNLVSARMLHQPGHGHGHDHGHDCGHGHGHGDDEHHDPNLEGAYLHVLADALTSVLAIVALVLGALVGWTFLDPVMGMVGGLLVFRWSLTLLGSTSQTLLDQGEPELASALHDRLESIDDVHVMDMHVWQPQPGQVFVMTSVCTRSPRPVTYYKEALSEVAPLEHLTVEVRQCTKALTA